MVLRKYDLRLFKFIMFLTDLIQFIFFSTKALYGSHRWNMGPMNRVSGVGFPQMVSEFLVRRFGEFGLFPEICDQITIGLGDSIKSGLG